MISCVPGPKLHSRLKKKQRMAKRYGKIKNNKTNVKATVDEISSELCSSKYIII